MTAPLGERLVDLAAELDTVEARFPVTNAVRRVRLTAGIVDELNAVRRAAIIELFEVGMRVGRIADIAGVTPSAISQIVRHHSRIRQSSPPAELEDITQ